MNIYMGYFYIVQAELRSLGRLHHGCLLTCVGDPGKVPSQILFRIMAMS